MLSLSTAALSFAGAPLAGRPVGLIRMETKADLVSLANDLNPMVGFWDPLELSDKEVCCDHTRMSNHAP
jgi:hypothetical protein